MATFHIDRTRIAACALFAFTLTVIFGSLFFYQLEMPRTAELRNSLRRREHYAIQELKRHECIRNARQNITRALGDLFVGKKHVALADVPFHDNYGDSFIWDGEVRLSQYFGHEVSYHCAQCQNWSSYRDSCNWANMSMVMDKPAEWLVLYQGGGNWGTTWKSIHTCRLNLLRQYLAAGLTVVSMPQSVFYDLGDEWNKAAFASEQKFWEEEAPKLPGKMVVTCRQHDSCDVLAAHFPKLEIRRVPDIAFMIPPVYARKEPVTDLLFLVRRDIESMSGYETNLKIIEDKLKGGTVTYDVYDWHQIGQFLPIRPTSADPSLKTQGGAEFLSRGKIIITDRLHGSILSLLMGKYHIYIDNTYHKVEHTRKLALSHEACTQDNVHGFKALNMEEAIAKGVELSKEYDSLH